LEGQIISSRPIIIKESDRLGDNTGGMVAGGAMGAVLGSGVGKGTGQNAAVVGGAVVGAVLGSAIQGKLGENKGYEYIIKVDVSKIKNEYYEGSAAMRSAISAATTGGLVTIVQADKNAIPEGQKVYVIFSDKRTRIIPAK
jgi:outer membrane lipoprotein SlyB